MLAIIEAMETSDDRKLRHIYLFKLFFLTENGVPPSGNTRAVVGPDAHQRWSGRSDVNNKQSCTMHIEAGYIGYTNQILTLPSLLKV